MAEKCRNCISARPTPPHTNPMESAPGNTFSAQNRKNQKIHDFWPPKKGGGSFFRQFSPLPPHPPPPTSLKSSKKWVSSRGVRGASRSQSALHMHVLVCICSNVRESSRRQKNILSYPSKHMLSQHPNSYPSEWVARGHHSKNG